MRKGEHFAHVWLIVDAADAEAHAKAARTAQSASGFADYAQVSQLPSCAGAEQVYFCLDASTEESSLCLECNC
jgi:hypothetical protein